MKRLTLIPLAVLLAACSREPNQDLKEWVRESDKRFTQKIEPLPEVKPYDAFAYIAQDMQDPFRPRKVEEAQKKKGENKGPDLNRRKELLESYPLDQLRFVGTMEQNKATHALVRADATIHTVKVGNYLGQNFGVVTGITETEIKLQESIQDSEGDWKEHETILQLIDDQEKKK
jgi:type IV pilus assembly protein PilP